MSSAAPLPDLAALLAQRVDLDPAELARYDLEQHPALADTALLGTALHDFLQRQPETGERFGDAVDAELRQLVEHKVNHFATLLTRPWAGESLDAGLALGRQQHEYGLSTAWLSSAHRVYLDHLEQRVGGLALAADERAGLTAALRKLVFYDLLLQLSGYHAGAEAVSQGEAQRLARLNRLYITLSQVSHIAARNVRHLGSRELAAQTLLREVCETVVEHGGIHMAWVGFIDAASQRIEPFAWAGADAARYLGGITVSVDPARPEGQGPSGRAVRSGQLQLLEDSLNAPGYHAWSQHALRQGFRSSVATPLWRDGAVIGVLNLYAAAPGFFGAEEQRLAKAIADKIDLALGHLDDLERQRQAEARLLHQATHDPLTGLPNRTRLFHRLEQALQADAADRLTVLMLDLDGFKDINDLFGHSAGDTLLCRIAERLRALCRPADVVARMGGDEFVVLLEQLPDPHTARNAVEQIISAVRRPVPLPDGEVSVSTSIGMVTGSAGVSADTLLRQADIALYRAKSLGRDQYCLFDDELERQLKQQQTTRHAIRAALDGDELALYYQPKVDLQSGAVIGAEALIRWVVNGEVRAPGRFLPALEGTELLGQIDSWAIRHAIAHAAHWHRHGLPLQISVNVSAISLRRPAFFGELRALLAEAALPHQALQLEVLESVSQDSLQYIIDCLQACKDIGVSLALDDFGTGASSLLHLQRIQPDVIKIDQRFVRSMREQPENIAIIKSVSTFSQLSGRTVIAEGVETEAIGQDLLALGVRFGQGYAIARPMPATDFPVWVSQWRPPAAWRCHVTAAS
ncbi:EAL domain-containing protein [Pseudogulbenkiania subflava]|uniref:Diguanylate cyclase (GGDEF) domain-containing protein n=1 Tax=Pseudogulbenkiania subflava DSM 22618 TaxID=1123014 RepID=A0A1Y6B6F5_9NEIS|nr:EAL domain-containing protein [Pseudogulbenkiania subflava]SME94591.1 diguanylate cyclase (GGDEF) domain-containing protein [Pseudogulbenkiania subflava DSM 22618]